MRIVVDRPLLGTAKERDARTESKLLSFQSSRYKIRFKGLDSVETSVAFRVCHTGDSVP